MCTHYAGVWSCQMATMLLCIALPWKWKANLKGSGSLPLSLSLLHHSLVILELSLFFAHLLILKDPDYHQNLISSSLYHPGPPPYTHKILSQSVHNFLSNIVHKQTDRKPILPKTLEVLRERRPPWPKQIITPILPTVSCVWKDVKMLLCTAFAFVVKG